jgi:hypothetical protein
MSGRAAKPSDREEEQANGLLDKSVQDHLGQKLRAAYNELADKPKYLGDPALPAKFDQQLLRMEMTIRTHEEGVQAVKGALADPNPAHEQGVEAVRLALTELRENPADKRS